MVLFFLSRHPGWCFIITQVTITLAVSLDSVFSRRYSTFYQNFVGLTVTRTENDVLLMYDFGLDPKNAQISEQECDVYKWLFVYWFV